MQFDLIVVGGGAAGFFGAIQAAERKPGLNILMLEKSNKLLSKVRISGGGRCNVTHHNYNPYELAHHYPRGEKVLKKLFKSFHAEHTVKWFTSKGVMLKAEADGRMFPVTDSSQTIIDCFIACTVKSGIRILLGKAVTKLEESAEGFRVTCADGEAYNSKKILITIGGSPSKQAYQFISDLYHSVRDPIPSLFTFNDSEKKFKDLMGVSVPDAEVRIAGTKFLQQGPLLITHWGLSGPAVIKLSAWAAEHLHRVQYSFTVLVNWLGQKKEDEVRRLLMELKVSKGKQKVTSNSLFALPQRLTQRLCMLAAVDESQTWSMLSNKKINRLVEFLIRCPFQIKGKTTFKEEFVTCGGVELSEINLETMESKNVKNIFFAGEVLNIDGETGGFNFQSAWTTAFIAARAIASGD
jgi:predicted Rossmann fold flavoprotein